MGDDSQLLRRRRGKARPHKPLGQSYSSHDSDARERLWTAGEVTEGRGKALVRGLWVEGAPCTCSTEMEEGGGKVKGRERVWDAFSAVGGARRQPGGARRKQTKEEGQLGAPLRTISLGLGFGS